MTFNEKCERLAWIIYVSAGPVLYVKYDQPDTMWIAGIMACMWTIGAWNIWKDLTQ